MFKYVLKKLGVALPLLLSVLALSFILVRLAPGSPFDKDAELPPEVKASLNATYNLDQPIATQFLSYITGVFQGDFGTSFTYRDLAVSEIIAQSFPVSALLGSLSLLVALILGLAAGAISALKPDSAIDYATRVLAAAGKSIPPMVLAPCLVFIFSMTFKLLPIAGWKEGTIADMILPIMCLSLYDTAAIARLSRGAFLEAFGTQRYAFLKARGISKWRVIGVHGVREVMIPLINYLAPALSGLLVGTVVVEQVFNIPGLGRYLVAAATNRDYTLVLGIVWLSSVLIIAFNLLADVILGFLDPRVRIG
jgi:oligopeptide transport system permease protein